MPSSRSLVAVTGYGLALSLWIGGTVAGFEERIDVAVCLLLPAGIILLLTTRALQRR